MSAWVAMIPVGLSFAAFALLAKWDPAIRWKERRESQRRAYADQRAREIFAREKPSEVFDCSHCGSGPWHVSWDPYEEDKLCPNCSGSD